MICTSIKDKDFEQIKVILADPAIEMAEIRLDLCPIAVEDIKELFGNATKPLVVTCRFSADNAWERLKSAVEAGAMFADLELFEDEGDKEAGLVEKEFTELCRKNGTRIIRSYHNFEGTPGLAILKEKVRQCFEAGADIAKIATTAKNFKDSCTIDSLYDWFNDEYVPEVANLDSRPGSCSKHIVPGKSSGAFKAELIAFAMGELGRVSRVDCLMNGAPFTYASLNADECTAPGQLSVEEMNVLLYNKKSSTSLDSANASDAEGNSCDSLTESEKSIVSMFSLENIVQQRNDNRKTLHINRIYDAVPASKSYAQRAIIAAALAQGTSRIYNYTPCADSEAAIEAARALGATISKEYTPQKAVCTLVINGIGASEKTRLHIDELHTGESGLLTRLMVPLISLLNDCDCRITGERTLVGRPLKGLKETMGKFGIQILGNNGKQDICIPFIVNVSSTFIANTSDSKSKNQGTNDLYDSFTIPDSGNSNYSQFPAMNNNCCHESVNMPAHKDQEPLRIIINGSNGSQIISGLMMALPMSGYDYEIIVENPKSIPYLRMTAQILAGFGIQISILPEYNATCYNNSSSAFEFSKETLKINSIELSGSNTFSTAETMGTDSVLRIRIRGNQIYKAADYVLEGDWSGAANLLVAGAILGRAEVHGLNLDTLQGDSVIIDILARAGAKVAWNIPIPQLERITESNDSMGRSDVVTAVKAPLREFNISLENTPDLFPIVALLAAFCSGESRIEGTHRLVGKESNRARAIVEMLRQMGVPVSLEDNTLIVNGESLSSRILNQRLPKGGSYSSHHDHRMAMALSIAALCTRSIIEIDDTECIAKSFPNFEC